MLAERAKHAAVALGIAVILPMLVYYGVASVWPPPEHSRPAALPPKLPAPGSEAEQVERAEALAARQAETQAEYERFEAAREGFARRLFLVAAPLGVLAIVAGGLIAVPAVGPGLLLGGVANLVVGYGHYWDHLAHWMRFVSLLVAFVVLVAVAWRRFGTAKKETAEP